MRAAVIVTLQALYKAREVTANKSLEYNTTRITNEISTLRNEFGIAIITDRVTTDNGKWYGSYRLTRTKKNLQKVRDILSKYSKENEAKKSEHGLI